jgi:pSer/pThr/pTyr-binding forkhead associated (FHA) protein
MLFNSTMASTFQGDGSLESTSLHLEEKLPPEGAGGPEAAELLVIEGQERGERVVLDHPATGIGRQAENRLVLSSKGVSRFHCQVIREEGRYAIEDLNSRHGTFQNGRRLIPRKPQPLRHGDRLRIVDQVILFHQPRGQETGAALGSIHLDRREVAAEASEILREMPGLKGREG